MFLGAHKNRLNETVLLSNHNIYFEMEIKKRVLQYALLSGGLDNLKSLIYCHTILCIGKNLTFTYLLYTLVAYVISTICLKKDVCLNK